MIQTTNQFSLARSHARAQDSQKMTALTLAVAVAAGVAIGTYFMCGIDLASLVNTVSSSKFYIMAGVTALLTTLFLFAGTECAKNFLSDEARENRLARDLLASYSPR